MLLTYSNPRSNAEFPDWPLGGNNRGLCRFHVEQHPKKGFRVGRTTINPKTGLMNATKFYTYGGPVCVVDGSDGKTYILQYSAIYNGISVIRHDFMNSEEGTVFQSSNPERFDELLQIIKATQS